MFVKSLQLASNFVFACPWSVAIFQVNELLTSELLALWSAYTLPEQNRKFLIMAKFHTVSS